MGLFFKTYSELSQEAIKILEEVRTKIRNDSDCIYAGYNDAEELRNEIDNCIKDLKDQNKDSLDSTYSHFMVTSTFQEHAMANGWHDEYLKLAEKFDKIYERMKQKK